MIEVQGLTHRYGPLTAVEELSFTVRRGEILGLLGPNGAGKTTTMRAVVGLLQPSEGRIRIGEHDLADDPLAARELLGYLPEAVSLYRELTVREMLAFAAAAKGVPRADREAEIERVVEACGLRAVYSRLLGFCSRGYRQRVGLAQALIGDPPALVLDEPTVGMDPAQVVDIRESIAELARDKAVILSTHILPEASRLCHRVLILHDGRCMAEDRPEALSAALSDAPRLSIRCRPPAAGLERVAEGRDDVRTVVREEDEGAVRLRVELKPGGDTPSLLRALVEAGAEVEELRPELLGLEEVFLKLVRHEEPTGEAEA